MGGTAIARRRLSRKASRSITRMLWADEGVFAANIYIYIKMVFVCVWLWFVGFQGQKVFPLTITSGIQSKIWTHTHTVRKAIKNVKYLLK